MRSHSLAIVAAFVVSALQPTFASATSLAVAACPSGAYGIGIAGRLNQSRARAIAECRANGGGSCCSVNCCETLSATGGRRPGRTCVEIQTTNDGRGVGVGLAGGRSAANEMAEVSCALEDKGPCRVVATECYDLD